MHDVSNKWTNNVTWHVCCLKLIHHTVRCKTAGCIELWISRSCISTHPSLFNSYTCDRSPGRSLHKLVLYGCVWIHKRCSSMKGAHKDGESGHTWPDSPTHTHTHTHTHRSSCAGVQPDGFISRLWQTDAPTETITSCLPFGLQKQHKYYRQAPYEAWCLTWAWHHPLPLPPSAEPLQPW